jgi:hypothetical protein
MIMDALERLAEQDVDLTDDVYQRFYASCGAASSLMRHTDQHMRGRMLAQVYELLLASDDNEYIEWEVDNHRSAYAVETDMYEPFLFAIRDAVRHQLGSDWQTSDDHAWDKRISTLLGVIAAAGHP